MTRSERPGGRAWQLLDRLSSLLDEDRMARLIDAPIDQVVREYGFPEDTPFSMHLFHRTLADFLRQISRRGMRLPRRLTVSQARDEAVCLLEQAYEGTHCRGYEAAVLDAADPMQSGIRLVLARLADALKARERMRYLRWVARRHIDPADWQTKCAMAKILLLRCRRWLPAELRNGSPAQWADFVLELLTIDLNATSQLDRGRHG